MNDLILADHSALPTLAPASITSMGDVYLASLQSAQSRRTMRIQLNTLARLLGYSDHHAVAWHVLKASHIAALQAKIREPYTDERGNERTYSPKSANLLLTALRGVLKASWRHGLLGSDEYTRLIDFQGFKENSVKAITGRMLSQDEINKLIRVCMNNGGLLGLRDAAILASAYSGGLRRDEIVKLDMVDVHLTSKQHYALTIHGKGNKTRVVYLTGNAARIFRAYLDLRGNEAGPVFGRLTSNMERGKRLSTQAIYTMFAARAKQAKIATFSPHDLRRTTISHHLKAGTDIATIANIVGHSNVNTTRRYDRRGEEAKEQAADNLHLSW